MIDWFTVVAQIVNFLILVALLRYFLYDRVLKAVADRQQQIEASFREAEDDRAQAKGELLAAGEKNRLFDEQREKMFSKTSDEVEQRRKQLTAQVRTEVESQRARWLGALREESDSFLSDIRRRVSEEVCAIAGRTLMDLADADLERQIVSHFIQRLERLPDSEREAVISSLQAAGSCAIVQSAHELSGDLRQALLDALRERFLKDLEIRFEFSEDLVCGIALQTDGHKLAWSVGDYLNSLTEELRQTLDEGAGPKDSPSAESTDEEP